MSVTRTSQMACFLKLPSSHPAFRGLVMCCSSPYRTSAVLRGTIPVTGCHHITYSLNNPHCTMYRHDHLKRMLIAGPSMTQTTQDRYLRCLSDIPSTLTCGHGVHQQQTLSFHRQSSGGSKKSQSHFILSPQGLFQAAPASFKPYLSLMRMDKPIGTWLLYLPCMWSISLAAPPGCLPDFSMLALFGLGALIMRGAGCTINDMWDKDFDTKVTRTRDRPLASGQVSYFQALSFLGVQLSTALGILLTMNWNTVFLGVAAMLPVIVYPLMKRVTYWPQAVLGITLNWGVLLAWAGLHGNLELPGITLYLSCVLWTMIYDTIYSHQDKEDDIMIGVKSTALRFGDDTKKWLVGFSGVMLGGLSVTGVLAAQTWPYFVGLGGVAAHLLYQITTVDLNNGDDCARKFRSNRNLGLLLWVAILMSNLLKENDKPKDKELLE